MTSRTQTVIALVKERGQASADDLCPLMPDCTREQVLKALENAKDQGWLDCAGHVARKGKGVGRGSRASTYTAREERRPVKPRKRTPGPVIGKRLRKWQLPSVFSLSAHMS